MIRIPEPFLVGAWVGLGLILSALPAFAGFIEASSSLHPVPVAVSGTLHPLAVSINGKEIEIGESEGQAILLNGKPVATVPGDPSGSFYLKTESNQIKLEVLKHNGDRAPIIDTILPSVRSLKLGLEDIQIALEGPSESITLDDTSVPIQKGVAELAHSSSAEWFDQPHVLEIHSKSGQGRIYNLDTTRGYDEVLRDQWVSLGIFPTHGDNDFGIGAAYGQTIRRHFLAELQFAYALSRAEMRPAYALNLEGGWKPWVSGQSLFDWKRISFDLYLSLTRSPDSATSGSSTYFTMGAFVRDELILVASRLGFVLTVGPTLIKGDPNGGNTSASGEITWHL